MPNVSLIAALDSKRGIGFDNNLLFRMKEDLGRFKRLTSLKPVIMGRKTYESIGKPLPNRYNIVISKTFEPFFDEQVFVAKDITQAMDIANYWNFENEIFVIGGEQIYKQFLPFANKQYLTIFAEERMADTFYPKWNDEEWKVTDMQMCFDAEMGKEDKIFFSFQTLERKSRLE